MLYQAQICFFLERDATDIFLVVQIEFIGSRKENNLFVLCLEVLLSIRSHFIESCFLGKMGAFAPLSVAFPQSFMKLSLIPIFQVTFDLCLMVSASKPSSLKTPTLKQRSAGLCSLKI